MYSTENWIQLVIASSVHVWNFSRNQRGIIQKREDLGDFSKFFSHLQAF